MIFCPKTQTPVDPSGRAGFRRKTFTGSQVRAVDESSRAFTATISTDARDRDSEILNPQGADLAEFAANPVILWAHDYSEPAIGRATAIEKEAHRIVATGQIASGTRRADEIYNLMKQGMLKAVSVGFIPQQSHAPSDSEKQSRPELEGVKKIHDSWLMLEYSIVNVPSNPAATITDVKSLAGVPETITLRPIPATEIAPSICEMCKWNHLPKTGEVCLRCVRQQIENSG